VYIITDENNVVVDMSTRRENLSIGMTFPNYTVYDIGLLKVNLDDAYDGKTVTTNEVSQQIREEDAANEAMIAQKIRDMAVEQLKSEGKLSQEFS